LISIAFPSRAGKWFPIGALLFPSRFRNGAAALAPDHPLPVRAARS